MLSRRLARRSKARLHPEPRPDDPNPPAYLKPTIESYGRPPTDENTLQWPGVVQVVWENDRYVIDDYLPIDPDSGQTMTPLSADFGERHGGRWVGLKVNSIDGAVQQRMAVPVCMTITVNIDGR